MGLSVPARLLLISLWTQADDEGRLYDQPIKIRGNAFGDEDRVSVPKLLDELSAGARLTRYEAGGRRCIQLLGFHDHQRIDRPKPSTIPPRAIDDESTTNRRAIDAGREGKGEEGNREGMGTEPTTRSKTASAAVRQPSHDHVYLVSKINERWGEGGNLSMGAVQKFIGRYGYVETDSALRALHGFPPEDPVRSAYAYVDAILKGEA